MGRLCTRPTAGAPALLALMLAALAGSPARAEAPAIMMAMCRDKTHEAVKIRLPDIDIAYAGRRADGTHAVNGMATAQGGAPTFQRTFDRSGGAIVGFVINPAPAPQHGATPRPDFADGCAGGPDDWQVTGLARGDALNVRAAPSAQAAIQVKLAEGAVVRNLGCRPVGKGRWCRIQLTGDADAVGWVNGRYLRKASRPPPGDAKVPGTPYDATGTLDCRAGGEAAARACAFGVVRQGPERARVDITLPDGARRTLQFDGPRVTASDGRRAVTARVGDSTIVTLDGAERFTVPDVIIAGD